MAMCCTTRSPISSRRMATGWKDGASFPMTSLHSTGRRCSPVAIRSWRPQSGGLRHSRADTLSQESIVSTSVRNLAPLARALLAVAAAGALASSAGAQAAGHTGHPTPAAAKPAAKPAASLPAPRQIIDKYVAAIGGRDALTKRSSSTMLGTFEMPAAGLRGDVVGRMAKPNRMVMSITFAGIGEIRNGFDGTTAWQIDPTSGPRVLEGTELSQARMQADFLAALHDEKNFMSMETVELADFEGKQAYTLRLIRAGGDTTFEYFDAESGLLVGTRATRDTQMGPMTATTVMTNYKDFGGIQMPTTTTVKTMGQEIVMSVTSIEWDNVEPTAFELPPEIKVLVTK